MPRSDSLSLAIEKMRLDGASAQAIMVFARGFEKAADGYDGHIAEAAIEPLRGVPHVDQLPASSITETLSATALVKLNGGLGTSMGVSRAKSALEVQDSLTFLDICVRQVLALRDELGGRLPVTFMDSYRTSLDTLRVLERYPELQQDGNVPLEILQGRVPKLDALSMAPVNADSPDLEWCPPGHGELLSLLESTGLRLRLLDSGYRYLFVSNSDNLGAVPDARIPAWMALNSTPMVMEVCRRTLSDMKGGHVARHKDSRRLVLRDSNMVVPGEERSYEDISLHSYFNTNCLWFDLVALSEAVSKEGLVELPVIVNRKTLDPADNRTRPVIQLETGMGTSVGAFDGAQVIEVPREKFVPVKTTNHLLVVRSDFFTYTPDTYRFQPAKPIWPLVDLDPAYYRVLADFEGRFPFGPPSLVECTSLTVRGDVTFGQSVRCAGDVRLESTDRATIPDFAVVRGEPVHSLLPRC